MNITNSFGSGNPEGVPTLNSPSSPPIENQQLTSQPGSPDKINQENKNFGNTSPEPSNQMVNMGKRLEKLRNKSAMKFTKPPKPSESSQKKGPLERDLTIAALKALLAKGARSVEQALIEKLGS